MKASVKSQLLPNSIWLVLAITLFILPFVPDEKLIRLKLLWLEMGIFTAGAVWLLWCGFTARIEIKYSKISLPVILYAVYFTVLYYSASNPHVALMEFKRAVLCMSIFIIASHTLTLVSVQKRLMYVWLTAVGIISLYGILQHYGGAGRIVVPQMDRVMGTFGNPIFFAAHLVMAVPLIYSLIAIHKPFGIRISLILLCALILTAVFFTQTRASFLAAASGSFLWLIAKESLTGWKIAHYIRFKKWVIVSSIIGVCALHGLLSWVNPSYNNINRSIYRYSRGLTARHQAHTVIWRDTLSMWLSAPVFGKGLGTFHIYFPEYASDKLRSIWPQNKFIINDAHNEYLQILAESGIVGFSLFMWIIIAYMRTAWKKMRETGDSAGSYEDTMWLLGIVISSVMLLVQNIFSVDMRFVISSAMLFIMIGMAVAGVHKTAVFDWRRYVVFRVIVCVCLLGILLFVGKSIIAPYRAEKALLAEPDFFEKKILEPAKTLKELHALAAQYPDNASVFEKLGWVYAKDKKWKEAIQQYKKAVQLDPRLTGGYNNLGNIYFSIGQRAQAMSYYTKALAIDPDLIDAHMNLGICYFYEGRLKESADHMKEVLELDPRNAKARDLLKRMVE